jgi:hypothetical protein
LRYDDNLTTERNTFVTHLECAATGEHYPADQIHNLSRAGKPLLVRYDLDGARKALSKEVLNRRAPDLWRYRELLPVRRLVDIVSLGEAMTPIVPLPKLAAKLGAAELLVKDEGRLPTGSFKARGLVMAVSMAKALGITHMAMPTNGNAGAALAAYASHAGIKTTIFCPEDTPEVNVSEIGLQGATARASAPPACGGEGSETLPPHPKPSRQKLAAVAQPFIVNAVTDPCREMPLGRNIKRRQSLRRLKQRLRRNEIVAIAVHQKNRRARFDLGGKAVRVQIRRQYQ